MPFGAPASARLSMNFIGEIGVYDGGFATMVHPAASAAPTFQDKSWTG